jgi:hypothetical protein
MCLSSETVAERGIVGWIAFYNAQTPQSRERGHPICIQQHSGSRAKAVASRDVIERNYKPVEFPIKEPPQTTAR